MQNSTLLQHMPSQTCYPSCRCQMSHNYQQVCVPVQEHRFNIVFIAAGHAENGLTFHLSSCFPQWAAAPLQLSDGSTHPGVILIVRQWGARQLHLLLTVMLHCQLCQNPCIASVTTHTIQNTAYTLIRSKHHSFLHVPPCLPLPKPHQSSWSSACPTVLIARKLLVQ